MNALNDLIRPEKLHMSCKQKGGPLLDLGRLFVANVGKYRSTPPVVHIQYGPLFAHLEIVTGCPSNGLNCYIFRFWIFETRAGILHKIALNHRLFFASFCETPERNPDRLTR